MDITQFHTLVDTLFQEIEHQLDDYSDQYDADIDCEIHGNVVSITFENNSKIIINTQEPILQIWMATSKQGYHFNFKDGRWICNRSGESFNKLFNDSVNEQINK